MASVFLGMSESRQGLTKGRHADFVLDGIRLSSDAILQVRLQGAGENVSSGGLTESGNLISMTK